MQHYFFQNLTPPCNKKRNFDTNYAEVQIFDFMSNEIVKRKGLPAICLLKNYTAENHLVNPFLMIAEPA